MSVMLLLLVSASCLAAASAQRISCTMDNKWSATMFDIRATSQGYGIMADFYYDFMKGTTAIQYYQSDSQVKARKVVTSYFTKERYNIEADGTCTKVAITEKLLPNAVVGERTELGSSYIGASLGGLKSDNWFFPLGTQNVTVSFAYPGCVLTFQGIVDTAKSPPEKTAFYFNKHTAGITDPSAFSVPSSCQLLSQPVGKR
ncbi:uncharacterized protein LOC124271972 [Haliotis rubra]|uniref:uncharacterized protein LOC124271972 n=1 Tax=Haliotis rubra TaxID=36100 RepID=UPI001EE51810|nr:uncharacterized protein LOC124271972 [Haliotis rubra]